MAQNFNPNGFNANNPNANEFNGDLGNWSNPMFPNPVWLNNPPWTFAMGNPYHFQPENPIAFQQNYVAFEDHDEHDDLYREDAVLGNDVHNTLNAKSRHSENQPQIAADLGAATSKPPSSAQPTLDELKQKAKASIGRVKTSLDQMMALSTASTTSTPTKTLHTTPTKLANSTNIVGRLESNQPSTLGKSNSDKMNAHTSPAAKEKHPSKAEDLKSAIEKLLEENRQASTPTPKSGKSNLNSAPASIKQSSGGPARTSSQFGKPSTLGMPSQAHKPVNKSTPSTISRPALLVERPSKVFGQYTKDLVTSPEEGEVSEDDVPPITSTPKPRSHVLQTNNAPTDPFSGSSTNAQVEISSPSTISKPLTTTTTSENPVGIEEAAKDDHHGPGKISAEDTRTIKETAKSRELRDAPPLTNRLERRNGGYGQAYHERRSFDRRDDYETRYRGPFNRDLRTGERPITTTNEDIINDRSRMAAEYKQRKASLGNIDTQDNNKEHRVLFSRSEPKPSEGPARRPTKPQNSSVGMPMQPTSRQVRDTSMPGDDDLHDWLQITGYYNKEYRTNTLARAKKKLELQKQLQEQVQAIELEEAEERAKLVAPGYLLTPSVVPKKEVKEEITQEPLTPVQPKRSHSDSDDENRPYRNSQPRLRSPSPRGRRPRFSTGRGGHYSDGPPRESTYGRYRERYLRFYTPPREYPGSNYKGKSYDPHYHDKLAG